MAFFTLFWGFFHLENGLSTTYTGGKVIQIWRMWRSYPQKKPFFACFILKNTGFYPLFFPFVKSYPHFEKSNGGQPVFVHIFPHFGKSYPFFIHA